jgi:type I restriction enzyme S subunit
MGSEWGRKTLGDVIELKRGYDLPKKSRVAGSIPLVSSAGVSDFHNEAKVKGPGVVTGRYGTIGEVFYSEEDFWPLNTTLYVRDFKGNDKKFIYYFLKTIDYLQYSDKAAVPGVNRNHLHMAEVFFPEDVATQKKIAEILGTLDNKIALNRQINTTLESMAQALFKSWFVDFDPVIDNALAAGNEIPDALQKRAAARAARREALHQQASKTTNETTNKTTGATDAASSEQALPETGLSDQRLPSEIQQLFPDRFVFTEEMGWVPEGWEVKPLSQFGQIVCGKTPSKSKPEFFGSDIPFIKIPDMHDNVFVVDPNEKLSNQGANSQVKKMLPRGSVCVSCIATVGKVVITVEPSQTNQQINSIVPHDGFLTEYLYFYMQTLEKHFHDLASGGSATLNMNTTTFGKVEILSPDSKVLDFFHRFVERSFSQIELRLRQSLTLTQLRDSLLPKLLSGQITLPDAEQQLAEVL